MFSLQAQTDSTYAEPDTAVTDEGSAVMPEIPAALQLNGYIQTDDRMRIDGYKLNRQEYRLDLKAEYKPSERAHFYTEIWLRSYSMPDIHSSADLSSKKNILNLDADLREAYFDIYGLFTKNLDVRIGRQRIAWGTGDKLNPTDNLNPYDLEDVWDFGRHLSSNSIRFNYYAGSFTFTAAGTPWFTPSVLPGSDWTPAFTPEFKVPGLIYDSSMLPGIVIPTYLTLNSISDSVILPPADFKHYPSFGFKVKKNLGNWEVSGSYVYTRDALPVISRMHSTLTLDTLMLFPAIAAFAHVDARAYATYPGMKIAGFDFAGSLFNLGVRGEAACFFPDRVMMTRTMTISAPAYGMIKDSTLSDSLVLDNKPYVKFIAGIDYTFRNGIYINFQYLHGFLHERGAANLDDYFILGTEWKFYNDKVKLSLLNGALQIGDWKDAANNHAWMWMPEMTYAPVSNAELCLGAHILDGSSKVAFGKVSKNDEVYIKLRYSF